jgi:hypothetical protein
MNRTNAPTHCYLPSMARPPPFSEPVEIRVGSVWTPRWPERKNVPVKVKACVQLANGTNFVVESLEAKQINRTRRVSYKYLLAVYVQAE